MMITAGTVVRAVLTGCTVGFAWNTRSIIIIFIVTIRADLQAYGQIDDVQMSGSASQTAILSSTGTRFAGLVTRPANTALIREAPWGTSAHTSIVQSVVLAGNALGRSLTVASLRVALGITIMQHHQLVVRIGHHVLSLSSRNVVAI